MKALLLLVVIAGIVGYLGITTPYGDHFKIRVTESKGFHIVEK